MQGRSRRIEEYPVELLTNKFLNLRWFVSRASANFIYDDTYPLYYAMDNLLTDGVQWYNDIDFVIHSHFVQWLVENPCR